MTYNHNSMFFDSSVIINDTTAAANNNGSLVVAGGASLHNTSVTGRIAVNTIDITPNLNDIIYENEFVCAPSQTQPADITNFYFSNSASSAFKAFVNVNVAGPTSMYAAWEITGVYKPDGWIITSVFTGDRTGVNFSIANENNAGQVKYTNTNDNSSTVTLRFRAQTNAPPGSAPSNAPAVINNTAGGYSTNAVIYANTPNTTASTDLTFSSNVYKVGTQSKFIIANNSSFVSYSAGGALTSMGDASIAKKLIVGEKIGIANQSPAYTLDIGGDVNFTGSIYRNGQAYGSSMWTANGTDVFYTGGNFGLGTTSPGYTLDVSGGARITQAITVGSMSVTDVQATAISSGSLRVANDVRIGGDLYVTGTTYSVNVTTSNVIDTNITVANALVSNLNVGHGTASSFVMSSATLGSMYAGSAQLDNSILTNATVSNLMATSETIGSALMTNLNVTNTSVGKLFASSSTIGSFHALNGTIAGHLIPATDITYDLGSATNRWRDGYFAGSTIYLGSQALSVATDGSFNMNSVSTGSMSFSSVTGGSASIDNVVSTNLTIGSAHFTDSSIATLNAANLTAGNINFTGSLYQNGSPYVSSQWSGSSGSKIFFGSSGSFNVGIGTTNPQYSLDVNGATRIMGILAASSGIMTDISATNFTSSSIVSSSISSGTAKFTTLTAANSRLTTVSAGTLAADIMTGGSLSLSGDLFVAGTINSVNVTTLNIIDTNITSGSAQIGNANITSATIGGLQLSALNLATGLTAGSVQATSLNATSATLGALQLSALNLATGLTAGSIQATSLNATSATLGALQLSALNLATGLTAGSVQATSLNATSVTASNLIIGNNINFGMSKQFSGSFTAANNVTSASSVTGLSFPNASVVSFSIQCVVSVTRSVGGTLFEHFLLDGIQTNSGWVLYISSEGDVSGFTLSINSSGQIQYVSTNQANYSSSSIRFAVNQINM